MLANCLGVVDTGLPTPPEGLSVPLFSLLLTIGLGGQEEVEGPAALLVIVVLLIVWL